MRARNLKPGFFSNPKLGKSDPINGWVFEGLWCMADPKGRLEDDEDKIHGEVNRFRHQSSTSLALGWLSAEGFIVRYEAAGKRYIWIPQFADHQNPHIREKPRNIPPYQRGVHTVTHGESLHSASTGPAPDQHEASTSLARLIPDSGSLNPESPTLIPDSGPGRASPSGPSIPERGGGTEIDRPRAETPTRNGSANGNGHAHSVGELMAASATPPLIERAAKAGDLEQVLHLLEEHRSNVAQRAQVSIGDLPRLLGKYTLDQQRRMLVTAIELGHPDLSRTSLGGEEPGGSAHAQH